MIRKVATMLALLALMAPGVAAQELPALYRVVDVASDDVLNIRSGPTASADIIDGLEPDARHVVVSELNEAGTWGRVNRYERSGWVLMRYMAREVQDPWHELSQPLSCGGVEPGWLLDYGRDGSHIEYADFVFGEDRRTLSRDWAAPHRSSPLPRTAGFKATGRDIELFAAVTGESCNDTMSDRDYGLSITVSVRHTGDDTGATYRGCCSPAPDR